MFKEAFRRLPEMARIEIGLEYLVIILIFDCRGLRQGDAHVVALVDARVGDANRNAVMLCDDERVLDVEVRHGVDQGH